MLPPSLFVFGRSRADQEFSSRKEPSCHRPVPMDVDTLPVVGDPEPVEEQIFMEQPVLPEGSDRCHVGEDRGGMVMLFAAGRMRVLAEVLAAYGTSGTCQAHAGPL